MIWPTKEMVDEAHDAWADALDAEKKLDNHIKKLKKERTEVIKQKQIAKKRHEKMNKKFLEMKQKKDKKKDKEDASPDNKQDKQDASGGDKKQDKPGASHDDQKRSDAPSSIESGSGATSSRLACPVSQRHIEVTMLTYE